MQITPQVAGTVVAVLADDTHAVRAGQPLVRLDAADARIALDQAEAQLAQAVRDLRGVLAADAAMLARVQQRETEVARARPEMQRAADDAGRRAPLVASGAIGAEGYEHAKAQHRSAEAALATARARGLAYAQALRAGGTGGGHGVAAQHAARPARGRRRAADGGGGARSALGLWDPRAMASFAFLGFAYVLWLRSLFTPQVDFAHVLVPTVLRGGAMAFYFTR